VNCQGALERRNGGEAAVLSASKQAIAQAALAPGPHAVVSADREGIIRDWNETAEHIFGHSAGQAIGQTLDLIIPEEERADTGATSGALWRLACLTTGPTTCSISRDCDGMARA
jgi:PAS domain-containing protein